ncbi:MAG TPA: hypothetical protein VEJ47_13510 [Candidatus Eremiobacteraceae bacterium]|nr:hypothetical protein [Candidatus Eremiobacteraceae bacterium]
MRTGRTIRRFLANLIFLGGICFNVFLVALSVNLAYLKYWPQQLHLDPYACIPRPSFVYGRLTLPYTDQHPVARVASYDKALQAFLQFQFLCTRTGSDGVRLLLTAIPTKAGLSYRIFLLGQDDLLTDIPRLGQLEGHRLIPRSEMTVWSDSELSLYENQSHLFEVAGNIPVQQKLETLDPSELQAALADFLVFKSETDIRVLQDMDPKPQPLTHAQAEQSAADIITVARFYDLPLDYFLGVGAMENDYMDVNGDLTHAIWKARAQPGDIVLQRRRKRVLVSDYSVGAWQITRETLRAAHRLYLRDKRDYSLLPDHLRPSRQLDLNTLDGPVLTTYAGLLLRELLDHYHGDVQKALGAYNGGTVAPNLHYALAVTGIADYARRILEHAPMILADDPTKRPAANSPTPATVDSTVIDLPLRVLDLDRLDPPKL